jgi:hypothetical protein
VLRVSSTGQPARGRPLVKLTGLRKAWRRALREALYVEQERCTAASALVDQLIQATDLLVKATLLSQGYHQHHYGEWRRRHAG